MDEGPSSYINEAQIVRAIRLLRLIAGQKAAVFDILAKLEKALKAHLAEQNDLNELGRRDRSNLLTEANALIKEHYADIAAAMADQLGQLSRHESDAIVSTLKKAYRSQLEFKSANQAYFERAVKDVLIQGAPSQSWWERQAGDIAFRFAQIVRSGIDQTLTNQQIIAKVVGKRGEPGLMDIARNNAGALVHTSVQAVAADARRKTFEQNSDALNGIEQLSTLDSHTTVICIAYSGAKFDFNYEPIPPTTLPYNGGVPRHWGCRSVEVPITKTYAELGLDIQEPPVGKRASETGPIRADITMADYIKLRGERFADKLLGPGRAKLFLDGKITLQDLLDQSGRPLTLEQLKELD